MIASWLTQCSHEPPRLALAIRKNRLSHAQILETKKLCVNVLPRSFAGSIKKFKITEWKSKFDMVSHSLSPGGLPVVDECIGYLECEVEQYLDAGDHTLFIVHIITAGMVNPGKSPGLTTLITAVFTGNVVILTADGIRHCPGYGKTGAARSGRQRRKWLHRKTLCPVWLLLFRR